MRDAAPSLTFVQAVTGDLEVGRVLRQPPTSGFRIHDALVLQRALVDLESDESEDGQNEYGQYHDVTETTDRLH